MPPPAPTLEPIAVSDAAQIAQAARWDVGGGPVNGLALSPDGSILASATEDGFVRLWNPSDNSLIRTLDGAPGPLAGLDFSPDGTALAAGSTGSTGGSVTAWDVASGELRFGADLIAGQNETIHAVDYDPGGSVLAAAGSDGRLYLLDAQKGKVQVTMPVSAPWDVWALTYTPDGLLLISGGADGLLSYWDAATGGRLYIGSIGHNGPVRAVAVTADNLLLASGSEDRTIKLYDVFSADWLNTLTEHTDAVLTLAFSPDGTLLASGDADGTLRLWDVVLGQSLAAFDGIHGPGGLRSVLWTPDGAAVITAGGDGLIRIWRMPGSGMPGG